MARYMYILRDAQGRIVEKCDHEKDYGCPVRAGCTKEIIKDAKTLYALEKYKSDEVRIAKEIEQLKRAEAITSLKTKGDLPANFVDKKGV